MTQDWIDGFIAYTDNTTSPEIFRRWAAISAVSSSMERKTWVTTMGSKLYPNTYIILVAPAGVGKTEVTWRVRDIWTELEEHHIAPTSITKAALIDELSESDRRVIKGLDVHTFNSLFLCINELGVLLPAYENEFMNTLTDLWDCKNYSERRRTRNIEIEIQRAQLTLLAGCTPQYLTSVLPEGAWDQGFMSRTLLVYSGDRQIRSLFGTVAIDQNQRTALVNQLKEIGTRFGEFSFDPETVPLLERFNLTGGNVIPDHPKLQSYNTRRTVHLLKLCMISSASRSDDFIVQLEDFHRALDWIIELEHHLPEIFKAMSVSSSGRLIEEAWHFIYTTYMREDKPIQKHRLINFLQERIPVHAVEPTILLMEQGKKIEKVLTSAGAGYKPLVKGASS